MKAHSQGRGGGRKTGWQKRGLGHARVDVWLGQRRAEGVESDGDGWRVEESNGSRDGDDADADAGADGGGWRKTSRAPVAMRTDVHRICSAPLRCVSLHGVDLPFKQYMEVEIR